MWAAPWAGDAGYPSARGRSQSLGNKQLDHGLHLGDRSGQGRGRRFRS
jgi:hypothetical protein